VAPGDKSAPTAVSVVVSPEQIVVFPEIDVGGVEALKTLTVKETADVMVLQGAGSILRTQ
jgi:hypothetical protein